jgi:fimbrial chaperone protein
MYVLPQGYKTLPAIIQLLILIFIPAASFAVELPGLSLNAMRIIYPESAHHGVPVTFSNNTAKAWMVQSSVREMNPQTHEITAQRAPFIVLPPLAKVDAQNKIILNVLRTGGDFPTDSESVFYLSVKMIPSLSDRENNKTHINFAYVNNLRLFYRPVGLAKEGTAAAAQKLTFRLEDNKITVSNPGAYYIPLAKLQINNIAIPAKALRVMVPPKGEATYSLPVKQETLPATATVRWQATDEDGNLSKEGSQTVKKGD